MDELPATPNRYQKGWLSQQFFSITVTIHEQIGDLKRSKQTPYQIHLSRDAAVRFTYEQCQGSTDIREAPEEYLGLEVVIDSDLTSLDKPVIVESTGPA